MLIGQSTENSLDTSQQSGKAELQRKPSQTEGNMQKMRSSV